MSSGTFVPFSDEKNPFEDDNLPNVSSGDFARTLASHDQPKKKPKQSRIQQALRLDLNFRRKRGAQSGGHDEEEDNKALMNALDYDNYLDQLSQSSVATTRTDALRLLLLKFAMTGLVAFVTAMIGYFMMRVLEFLGEHRSEIVAELIEKGNHAGAFFAKLGIMQALAFIASALTLYLAPRAAGGGMPYVMAYLNGTYIPQYLTWRIVWVKVVALVCVIAAGLPLGMEGPFVYIGGGVAVACAQFLRSRIGKYSLSLMTINEERFFMAGGAAAGLAVAFSAPLAGVLLVINDATAFVTTSFTTRVFACAMFAQLFSDMGHSNWGSRIKSHTLITLTEAPVWPWSLPELFAFVFIGLLGACVGSFGIWLNMKITPWRHHHLPPSKKLGNFVQMALFTLVVCILWFSLPYMFACRPVHEDCELEGIENRCQRLHCEEGHYSDIGSLLFGSSEHAMKLLLDRAVSLHNDMSVWPLLVYAILFFLLTSFIYGAYVPGGLYVPSVIVGGCYGRVIGILLAKWIPDSHINPGVYSMLGAGSLLGGFNRQALPIVVMLMEMSGDSTFLLPIMITGSIAKVVGDQICPAMYPQHMKIEQIPILGETLPHGIDKLKVQDIMEGGSAHAVESVEQVSTVLRVLKDSNLTGIPVTKDGRFFGMIMRKAIIYALTRTKLYPNKKSALKESEFLAVYFTLSDMVNDKTMANMSLDYMRAPRVDKDHLQDYVNLTPYVDQGCFAANLQTPCTRVQSLFRRCGTSAVCVVDSHNRVLGVITRGHLLKPPPVNPGVALTDLFSYAKTDRRKGSGGKKKAAANASDPMSPAVEEEKRGVRRRSSASGPSASSVAMSTLAASSVLVSPNSAAPLMQSHSSHDQIEIVVSPNERVRDEDDDEEEHAAEEEEEEEMSPASDEVEAEEEEEEEGRGDGREEKKQVGSDGEDNPFEQ